MKLLGKYSAFFREEVVRLITPVCEKRKRTPEHDDGVEAAVKVEDKEMESEKAMSTDQKKPAEGSVDIAMTDDTTDTAHHDAAATLVSIKEEEKVQEPEPKPTTKKSYMRTHLIDCSDIDPAIFGLFLRFIYTGFYAVHIDAESFNNACTNPTTPHPMSAPHTGPPFVPPHAQPPPSPPKVPFELASKEEKARILLAMITARKGNQDADPAPTPTPPPPAAPRVSAAETWIPPSIHAYLLAHRLASPVFMNHTIHHIYHAIGRDFPLTPWLVDWVWKRTAGIGVVSSSCAGGKVRGGASAGGGTGDSTIPTTTAPTTAPTAPTSTTSTSSRSGPAPPPSPPSANGGKLTPTLQPYSPLRKLILNILIQHWPSQDTHIIARNQETAWNKVFDRHGDLRHDMMMGLQGGVKVGVVEGYYVKPRG